MQLDEMLKQVTSEETPQINLDNKLRVESESKKIYMLVEKETGSKNIYFETDFEKEFADDIKLLEQVKARIDAKKEELIKFIEDNDLASFKTNMLQVKYTSATITTTIDSARLKKEMPEIAAKYSKVGTRSSSVSVGLCDMPEIAKELL